MQGAAVDAGRLKRFIEAAHRRGDERHESPKAANLTHAFFELYSDLPLAERQARSHAFALLNEPISFDPDETIAGQVFQACPGAGDPFLHGGDPQWNDWCVAGVAPKRVAEALTEHTEYGWRVNDGAAPGHIAWDWPMVLRVGLDGLMEQYRQAAADASDPVSREFYQCGLIALEGAAGFAERIAEGCSGEMRERCHRVPRQPARSFREAIQAFWTLHLAVMFENPYGGNGPGLLDRHLWPYLERDLASGVLDMEEAREILLELFVKIDERIRRHDGWVEAICVGGRTADGGGAESPLSALCIECLMELDQSHPSVYVKLRDDAPQEFRMLAARYLLEGGNRAQLYGDDRVIEALVSAGCAYEDAVEWAAGGCMEVGIQGRSCDFNFCYWWNVALALEAVLYGGEAPLAGGRVSPLTADLTSFTCFEDLMTAVEREMARQMDLILRRLDIYFQAYAEFRPNFLISTMVHDCFERGRPINGGGARYADYAGSAVGLPNVADALVALKYAVYEEGFCTAEEMLAALRANFVGHEQLRRRLLDLPKFGQDHEEADEIARRVLRAYTDACEGHRTPQGGRVRPLVLGFVWVVREGERTGALPDGRLAGEPLAQSLAPQNRSASRGLLSALRSVAKLDLREVSGGASTMFDLDPEWASAETAAALVKTYFDQGGHIFQGNSVALALLEAARQEPEEHRNLMVRVGGWSARFVTLDAATQDEIIARRRFSGS